jgi:2-phosphoglycerate kinase
MVEGAHLLPGELRARLATRHPEAVVLEALLTLDDEGVHRSHLLRRVRSDPARQGARHLENFAAIRELQDHLRRFAREAEVGWFDLAHPGDLTERIVDRVVAAIEGEVPA